MFEKMTIDRSQLRLGQFAVSLVLVSFLFAAGCRQDRVHANANRDESTAAVAASAITEPANPAKNFHDSDSTTGFQPTKENRDPAPGPSTQGMVWIPGG